MTRSENIWKIERTCSKCGQKDAVSISKRDAAFELVDINDILGNTCKRCSSTSFTTSYQRPDLEFYLLKEWATNPDLHLMPQDEELLLADEKYVDMILQVLDTVPIPDHKRDLLMNALCILVYDNTVDDNFQRNDKLKNRVIKELNERQEKLKLADKWIPNYIKEIVYPKLNF
jgi:hypothetical protein